MARTFEFVLQFVGCVTVTVSPNQIIIIIIIIIIIFCVPLFSTLLSILSLKLFSFLLLSPRRSVTDNRINAQSASLRSLIAAESTAAASSFERSPAMDQSYKI